MSLGWNKTQCHRKKKRRRIGAKAKRSRDNHGTTASVPLTGPMPSLRYGRIVAARSICVDVKVPS